MAKILIVEDDTQIREMLTETLRRWGYTSISAENGRLGLEKHRDGNFTLIITDIRMPEMDGLQMIKAIRQKDKLTPIIVITAFPSVGSAVESLEYGADHYLVKPVNLNDLKAKINKCLEKSLLYKKYQRCRKINMLLLLLIPICAAAGFLIARLMLN